jgi:hypothetical protein
LLRLLLWAGWRQLAQLAATIVRRLAGSWDCGLPNGGLRRK